MLEGIVLVNAIRPSVIKLGPDVNKVFIRPYAFSGFIHDWSVKQKLEGCDQAVSGVICPSVIAAIS
jgi:hypothetical protein